jgi:hypothetical protein
MYVICRSTVIESLYLPDSFIAAELYTSDKNGSDESGDGSEGNPFRTILQAMRHAGKEPFPIIYVDAKEEGQVNEICATSNILCQLKLEHFSTIQWLLF